MKKRISLLLVLTIALIVFALTGCTKETSDPTDKSDTAYQFAKPAEGDIVAEIVVEDFGSIYVKFFKNEAPKAVENFITHANEGYYDGVTFHRVINDFMIQGGDPDGTGYGGESIWGSAFEDEFSEKIKPYRGALCMANAGANTNGSQFFLVQAGSSLLAKVEESCKYYDKTLSEYFKAAYGVEYSDELAKQYIEYGGTPWLDGHHTVFGQIFEGYDVLDKIAATPVNSKSVPETKVVIKTIRVYTYGGGNGV